VLPVDRRDRLRRDGRDRPVDALVVVGLVAHDDDRGRWGCWRGCPALAVR
jgi:hypothetical protein